MRWLAVGVLLTGCGNGPEPGVIATGVVQESIDDFANISRAMVAGSGADGLAAAVRLILAGQVIVTQVGDTYVNPIGYMNGIASCTNDTCTFTMDDSSYPGTVHKFEGRIVRSSADTFDISLHSVDGFCRSGTGSISEMQLTGGVTANATMVDGSIHLVLVGGEDCQSLNGGSTTADIHVEYRAIAIDARGCAIGGSVHATSVNSVDGFDIEGTHVFGPACGE